MPSVLPEPPPNPPPQCAAPWRALLPTLRRNRPAAAAGRPWRRDPAALVLRTFAYGAASALLWVAHLDPQEFRVGCMFALRCLVGAGRVLCSCRLLLLGRSCLLECTPQCLCLQSWEGACFSPAAAAMLLFSA